MRIWVAQYDLFILEVLKARINPAMKDHGRFIIAGEAFLWSPVRRSSYLQK
jgi:hypothetical protein